MFPIRDNIPSRTVPLVNYLLIITCVMVFFMQLSAERAGHGRTDVLAERFAMIPQRILHPGERIVITDARPVMTPFGVEVRERRHALAPPPITPWLTLLTCIFLHGGWLHIIGNMWFLFIFGDNVEDRLGHFRYLLFYLGCGLASSVTHLVANWHSTLPTLGASGAIAGVMGAYFILYPRARVLTLIPIFIFLHLTELPAPVFLGFWFLLQFLQGTMSASAESGGVAWWAHIGGFVAGVVMVFVMRRTAVIRPPVERRLHPINSSWSSRRW